MNFLSLNTKLLWIFCLVVGFSSCQKVLDINQDPNKPTTALPELILPTAQVELGLSIGNTWNYVGSMWAQYWTGGHGVSSTSLEYYTMTSADIQTAWTRAYARCLADMDYLNKSDEVIYGGMSKIMSAYLYQMLVDLHGDVPFTDAIKGLNADGSIGNTSPKYDTEREVYASLIPLIDSGVALLNKKGQINPKTAVQYVVPTSVDLIFAGDLNKWKVFANTLKLKILVRQGKTTEAKALMDTPGITFVEAGEYVGWKPAQTTQNTNPLYARFESRTGIGMYYVAAKASIDKLSAMNDPRIDGIYKKGTAVNHQGIASGDVNVDQFYQLVPPTTATVERQKWSQVNPVYVYGSTVPVIFISGWESKFLQAEVLINSGLDATSLFEQGVQASFDYYGLGASAVAYIGSLGFSASASDKEANLDILGVQKWISFNGLQMAEGWLETLRFDRPGHPIFTGSTGIYTSPIQNSLGTRRYPTSFVYPTQEVTLNANAPTNRTVTSTRFWDVN